MDYNTKWFLHSNSFNYIVNTKVSPRGLYIAVVAEKQQSKQLKDQVSLKKKRSGMKTPWVCNSLGGSFLEIYLAA